MCQIRVFKSILNHPWMPSSSWHTAKTGTQKRVLEKDQLLSKYCCIKNGFSWSEVNKWKNKYRITIPKQRHSAMWTSSFASTPTSNDYWCVDIAAASICFWIRILWFHHFFNAAQHFKELNGFAIDTNAFAELLWCFECGRYFVVMRLSSLSGRLNKI